MEKEKKKALITASALVGGALVGLVILFVIMPIAMTGGFSRKLTVPEKGYKAVKEKINDQLRGFVVQYNECSYAYVTGDGTEQANENINKVFYAITISVQGVDGSTDYYYPVYNSVSSEVKFPSGGLEIFTEMEQKVDSGALLGETGSLK